MSDQPPSKGKDDLDDIFHPLPPSGDIPPISTGPSSGSVPPISTGPASGSLPPLPGGPISGDISPQYVPPPPGAQPRRPNAILYILLGAALVLVCICGACLALFGGGILSAVNNPTVRSALVTVQVAVGTAGAQMNLPQQMPKNNHQAGTISAGQTQSGNLVGARPDVWQYQGSSGQKLSVTVTAQNNQFDPLIGIYGSDGNLLAKTSIATGGSHEQTLTYQVPEDGQYNILVTGFVFGQGTYDIKVAAGSE